MKMRGIDWGHFLMGWFTAMLLLLSLELAVQVIYGNTMIIILDSVIVVINILCVLFWHQYCARKRTERKLDKILDEFIFDTLREELSKNTKNTKHRKEKEVI